MRYIVHPEDQVLWIASIYISIYLSVTMTAT